MRKPVALPHASRLLNHGPTVLVSSAHRGCRNVMAAAWSMPVEFTPPRIAVVIDKSTYTRELVAASGAFALNIPCRAQADLAFAVGSTSGRASLAHGTDKFAEYGIDTFDGPELGLPLVAGCIAWMECRTIAEPHAEQAYDTFFAEVASAQADPRVFDGGKWHLSPENAALHTLHHLGGGVFAVAAEGVRAKPLPGRHGR
ncbi:flavin reductase family protein [Zeimonas arvi]|uniref:Flavin reductase family protein n=1 Tax=Zeimonas arvi TaxID=2498847 RepID=A0A5C8P5B1_9BURK|nr:flavin reductase family protein [Zeimonas arvi]TXL68599.1 flavin reductase family protein [Zeimonas arvi]